MSTNKKGGMSWDDLDGLNTKLSELATNKDSATDGQVLTSNGDGTGTFEDSGSSTLNADYVGIKLLVSGDSITEGVNTDKQWHSYLADWLGCSVLNDGKDGTGLIRNTGTYYRIDTWDVDYGDLDAIIIMGNMNDGGLGQSSFPVGTFGDTVAADSQYGALYATIEKLLVSYPNTPILWIISTPRLSNTTYPSPNDGSAWGVDSWFESYADAIIEMCRHYSIPYLDLYHESGLRPWDSDNRNRFFDSLGVHPNEYGHELMAKKIYPFVQDFMFTQFINRSGGPTYPFTLESGSISAGTGSNSDTDTRLRTDEIIEISSGATASFSVTGDYQVAYTKYDTSSKYSAQSSYTADSITIPSDGYYRFMIRSVAGTDDLSGQIDTITALFSISD